MWVGLHRLVYSNGSIEITFPLEPTGPVLEVEVFFYDPQINDDLSRKYFEQNQEKLKDSIVAWIKSQNLTPVLATESILGKYTTITVNGKVRKGRPGVFSVIGSFLRRCVQKLRKSSKIGGR